MSESMLPLDSEGGKPLWDQVQKHLPLFQLFQSDRKSKEDDDVVQYPLGFAVSQAIAAVEPELSHIEQRVKDEAQDVATRHIRSPVPQRQCIPSTCHSTLVARPRR